MRKMPAAEGGEFFLGVFGQSFQFPVSIFVRTYAWLQHLHVTRTSESVSVTLTFIFDLFETYEEYKKNHHDIFTSYK